MRLAVTVGFDEALVFRAIADVKADEILPVRGITGTEGDERSQETVRRGSQRGEEGAVNLRDPASGSVQFARTHFDAMALLGAPGR